MKGTKIFTLLLAVNFVAACACHWAKTNKVLVIGNALIVLVMVCTELLKGHK